MQQKELYSAPLVFSRLMEVANAENLKELAEWLDIKHGTLRSQKARGSIPYEEIVAKCTKEELAYVLKGNIQRKDTGIRFKIMDRFKVNEKKSEYNIKEDGEFYTIPFYASVKASAGGGLIPQDREPLEIAFRKYFVNNSLKAQASDLAALMIDGDSMNPTLTHDDLVLIDQSKRTPKAGSIMLIRIDESVSCKRVQGLPGHRYKIMSDNEAYESFEIAADQEGFEIIGQVIWFARSL